MMMGTDKTQAQERWGRKKPRLPLGAFAKKAGYPPLALRNPQGHFMTICDVLMELYVFGDVWATFWGEVSYESFLA